MSSTAATWPGEGLGTGSVQLGLVTRASPPPAGKPRVLGHPPGIAERVGCSWQPPRRAVAGASACGVSQPGEASGLWHCQDYAKTALLPGLYQSSAFSMALHVHARGHLTLEGVDCVGARSFVSGS